MKRDRKILVLSHCLLNVNSKIDGLAPYHGASRIVSAAVSQGYGLIQLPCVEQAVLGGRRWGSVYSQCDFPGFRQKSRELLKPVVDQIEDFTNNGYEIKAIVGINGSPTCGINYIPVGNWGGEVGYQYGLNEKIDSCTIEKGMGVMMEELKSMLEERGISIPFLAVDETSDNGSADILLSL